jgi:hypothetical protein
MTVSLLSINLMTKIIENPLQFVMTLRFFTLAPTGPLANADRRWFVLLEFDLDQPFCRPLIGLWLLGTHRLGASVVNPIGHLFWTFYFYLRQITVPIGLITGASLRSWFLLEDAMDFKIFWTSNSPTPRILIRIARVVDTESYLFSQETNHPSVACHPYKSGRHCNYCIMSFLALAFLSSIAFTIHCSMADTIVYALAAPVAPSATANDSGHNSGAESAKMVASSSPTRGATRMSKGEIPELTDFFKKTTVTEDDGRAYHDRGWLTGNLVSFIPEVDVPTIEGSTIICFNLNWQLG